MKKLAMTVGLAIVMAVPFATPSMADPDYVVDVAKTNLWQHSFARGSVRCEVQRGVRLNRHWGENWSRWIYVNVKTGARSGCSGWVDKQQLAVAVPADGWYRVNNPGSHVDLMGNSGLRCRIPHGEFLEVTGNAGPKPQGYRNSIAVKWMKRLGTMEWHWKSAHNRWCPHWQRSGWVARNLVEGVPKPGGNWIN